MSGAPGSVSVLAHRLAGVIARESRSGASPEALCERAWVVADGLTRGARLHGGARAGRLEVAGAVGAYVRWYLPPPEWTLEGVEVEVDGGRIDLAWSSPDGLQLFDELKFLVARTARGEEGRLLRQARRYAALGAAAHGDAFVGVRLLLPRAPHRSRLVRADGTDVALAATALGLGTFSSLEGLA